MAGKHSFNDMVSWGDDGMNNPNNNKELTKDPRELFIRWMIDEKFFWGVLSNRDRKTITSVLIENKYNTHNKWVLDQVREKFITYLKKSDD